MTEPSPARPVPGPPRPGSVVAASPARPAAGEDHAAASEGDRRFADLDQLPLTEHVAVFEAEHDRLQRELGTIDQL